MPILTSTVCEVKGKHGLLTTISTPPTARQTSLQDKTC